jgi:hypothetical protein
MLARRLRLPTRWLKDEAEADRISVLKAGRQMLFNVDAVRQTLAQRAAGEFYEHSTSVLKGGLE